GVERSDFGPQANGGQAEQPAAATGIQESLLREIVSVQQLLQGFLRIGDPLLVDRGQETPPVLAEGEPPRTWRRRWLRQCSVQFRLKSGGNVRSSVIAGSWPRRCRTHSQRRQTSVSASTSAASGGSSVSDEA